MSITLGYIGLSPAEWIDWKRNPATQEIMDALRREKDVWVKQLIDGGTLVPGKEVAETAKAVGVIFGIDCLLEGIENTLKTQWEEIDKNKEESEYGVEERSGGY